MIRFEDGMLAKSLAGHDEGKIYFIISHDDMYLYLVDGEIRTLANPKKKRYKHVQLIKEHYDLSSADDVKIKRLLKEYKQSIDC